MKSMEYMEDTVIHTIFFICHFSLHESLHQSILITIQAIYLFSADHIGIVVHFMYNLIFSLFSLSIGWIKLHLTHVNNCFKLQITKLLASSKSFNSKGIWNASTFFFLSYSCSFFFFFYLLHLLFITVF